MRILVITVLLLAVMAAQKKRKQTPNLIHMDDKEYKRTHGKIQYDVDSFTSPRSQQLKTAQKRQDSSLQRAILHSQGVIGFVQITDDQDLTSEMMSEQQIQQALKTSEDFNDIPNIEMQAESNYKAPDVQSDDVNEAYYIPIITEGDGSLEEVENSDEQPQDKPDIEMPSFLQQ